MRPYGQELFISHLMPQNKVIMSYSSMGSISESNLARTDHLYNISVVTD